MSEATDYVKAFTVIPAVQYIAHVLITNEDKVLLLHRCAHRYLGGKWDIPGGTVESNEEASAAAIREALEETGISVSIEREISHFVNMDTNGRNIEFHTITYLGRPVSGDSVLLSPEEHDEYCWTTLQDATRMNLVWHVRETIFGISR